jgi:hypothetical protein
LNINIGIDQVAQVVAQNSAAASESATASEEMYSHSSILQHLIAQFVLRDTDSMYKSLPPSAASARKRLAAQNPTHMGGANK